LRLLFIQNCRVLCLFDTASKPEVQKLYEQEIAEQMKDYARVEQIRKFKLLEREWSQSAGGSLPP
jgi:hypothetical protein